MPGHDRWLPSLDAPPAADDVLVFCLPYAGGGAAIFRQWAELAPPGMLPLPLRLPGREMRILERPIDTLAAMLDALVGVLRPFTVRPYAIFGHSMGALIGHELTLRILECGLPAPRLLAVSGRQAPHLPNPARWVSTRSASDEQFLEILHDIDAQSREMLANQGLQRLLLPVLRADFNLCEDYRPRPAVRLPIPIIAFAGDGDLSVPVQAVQAWSEHTAMAFNSEVFAGDHFFVRSHAAPICAALARCLLPGSGCTARDADASTHDAHDSARVAGAWSGPLSNANPAAGTASSPYRARRRQWLV
jgi:medium-chain acyl-[acyl-carrier-protein] hydrolase